MPAPSTHCMLGAEQRVHPTDAVRFRPNGRSRQLQSGDAASKKPGNVIKKLQPQGDKHLSHLITRCSLSKDVRKPDHRPLTSYRYWDSRPHSLPLVVRCSIGDRLLPLFVSRQEPNQLLKIYSSLKSLNYNRNHQQ